MTGGAIENCTASEGAGVKMYPDSGNTCTFTMSDSAEIKNCSNDGVSIAWSGTSKFIMSGGTIDNNKGYGLWTSAYSNTEILLSGGTITNSERYDMVILQGVQLHVNNATVSGKIRNLGTITGEGSAEFTGTVVNESKGTIKSGKFERIEDASAAGVCNAVEYEAYVKLIGHRWPDESTLKAIQDKAHGNAQLKFSSQVTPDDMENTLTIPEDVTVTVDLTGKQVAGENAEKKIINHGNLTLIDSGTGSTLNIPIENNGTLNANGGTVTGEVTNKGTITTTGEKATQFSGGVTNESDGKIENGTFSGEVTNNGAINDGTFSGNVTNNGTIGNGNFTGDVTNEQTGVISGGKFDESKLTNNGGTLPTATPAPTGSPTAKPSATYTTLRLGSTGDAVTRLVQELINQGYYTGSVTNVYTSTVQAAVRAFQSAKGLTVDGIAGKQTQHALFGTVEPGADDYTDYNFQFYPAEKIDWYTGGIQQLWAKGASYKIYDVKTLML